MRLSLIFSVFLLTVSSCTVTSCGTLSQAGQFDVAPLPSRYKHSTMIQHVWRCYTAEEVSGVMDQFLIAWNHERKVMDAFDHLTIIFTDDIDPKYLGLTYEGVTIFVRPMPRCQFIEETSLAHELLHVALRAISDGVSGDPEHKDPRWKTFLPQFEQQLRNDRFDLP